MALSDLFAPSLKPSDPKPMMSLNEFVYGEKKEKDSGGVMGFLELLGRPQLAIGEAVGALARDKDPWAAAGRGIRGEREYGTLGEQVFKTDEPNMEAMEALFKQAGALGLDIATDPAWLIGMPALGKAAGLASKGLPHLKKLPLAGDLAKYIVPITTQLRWFGGKAGGKIAGMLSVADDTGGLRTARAGIELAKAAKNFGVGKSAKLRIAAVEHLESGRLAQGVLHPDQRVQGFAKYIDDLTKGVGAEVESFTDLAGEGFKITEPVLRSISSQVRGKARKLKLSRTSKDELWTYVTTGMAPATKTADKGFSELAAFTAKKLDDVGFARVPGATSIFSKDFYQRPFQAIPNYFPHLATPDFLKTLGTEAGFSKAVREMAKMNGISEFEATKILRNLGTPRRAGNIEYARTLTMPGYEKDPLQALPRYFEQVFNRIEYAKKFGVQGKELNTLLKSAMTKMIKTPGGGWQKGKGISKADAGLIRDTILGKPQETKGIERVARAVMGYQVMTKMGPLSALSNISQNANTIVREGGVSFLKGVLRAMTDQGARQGKIAYSGGIHEHLLRMMGATGKGAEFWLKYSGFTPAERINRLLASNAGIIEAERLIRSAKGVLTNNLSRRGLSQADLLATKANNWKLPIEVADKVGLLASNATQHVTRLKDVPLAWQGPGMRMMVQFKSFVYQQTRFLMREIMKPAMEFFNSNGKKGSIGPLSRAAVTFGLGGGFIAHVRDQAKNWTAGRLRMDYEPRDPVPDDWALRVLEDSLNMGGLGVAGDLVQRAAQRDLKGWLLGPTYGDVSDVGELFATGGAKMYKEGEIDYAAIGAEALRHIPGFSPVIPKRGLKRQVEEKLGGLEQIFYGL